MKRKLRLIILGFCVSFLVVAVLSSQAIRQFGLMNEHSNAVDRAQLMIERLTAMELAIKDMDRHERGYMLTRDTAFYYPKIQKDLVTILPATIIIRQLAVGDSVQQGWLIQLRSSLSSRLYYLQKNRLYTDTARLSAPLSAFFYKGREKSTESVLTMHRMQERASQTRSRLLGNRRLFQSSTSDIVIYLMLAFGCVTVLLFLVLVNELSKRMRYQDELQSNLLELKRSHGELEQIAFAASHSFQEPLRKIKILTDRHIYLYNDTLDESNRDMLNRVMAASNRMQELVEDFVNFTSLGKEEEYEPVDMNEVVATVVRELQPKLEAKAGELEIQNNLPQFKGVPRQIHILFKSLLDNAIKFSHPDRTPSITLRCSVVSGMELFEISPSLQDKAFYRVTVTDNGIGFDNKFSQKMFRIFQRLHSEETQYSGKGIGLAICQRIVANHNGYILAHGHPQTGATFKVFFPKADKQA